MCIFFFHKSKEKRLRAQEPRLLESGRSDSEECHGLARRWLLPQLKPSACSHCARVTPTWGPSSSDVFCSRILPSTLLGLTQCFKFCSEQSIISNQIIIKALSALKHMSLTTAINLFITIVTTEEKTMQCVHHTTQIICKAGHTQLALDNERRYYS